MSSWKSLSWAKDQQTGSHTRKLILILLCEKADEAFSCFPKIRTLVKESEAARSTVFEALARLETDGFITRVEQWRDNGSQMHNRYLINHPDAPHVQKKVPVQDSPNLGEEEGGYGHRTGGVRPPDGGGTATGPYGGTDPGPLELPRLNPHPYPGNSLPAGSAHLVSAGVVEDPDENSNGHAAAESVLAGLSGRWAKLGRRDAAGLLPRVAGALTEGWSADALIEYLTADPPARICSVGALLRVRLENLPLKPPSILAPNSTPRPRRAVDPLADYRGSTAATRSADADAVVAAIRAKVPKGKPLRRR